MIEMSQSRSDLLPVTGAFNLNQQGNYNFFLKTLFFSFKSHSPSHAQK